LGGVGGVGEWGGYASPESLPAELTVMVMSLGEALAQQPKCNAEITREMRDAMATHEPVRQRDSGEKLHDVLRSAQLVIRRSMANQSIKQCKS
jgi:hypothetical protein